VSFVPFARVSRLSHSLLFVFVLCLLSHLSVSLDCLILFCLHGQMGQKTQHEDKQKRMRQSRDTDKWDKGHSTKTNKREWDNLDTRANGTKDTARKQPFVRVSRLSHSLLFVFVLCILFHLSVSLDCLILFCLFSCCVFCPIWPCL
jgi:uncharacterized membrane protein YesL